MNSLSIRTKLYGITALVSIILFGLGSIAIYSLRNVNDKSTEISGVWMQRVKLADAINTLASDYRAMQYNYITAVEKKDKDDAIANLSNMNNQMDKLFDEYIALARDSYKDDIRKVHAEWATYTKESSAVARSLSDAGKGAEAGEAMRTTLKVKFDAVNNRIVEYGKLSIQGAQDASAAADDIYNSTSMILISVIVLSLTITLFSLITITRSLVGGITKVLRASERVANGDLKETVSINTNDEIGRLGQATNRMIENLRSLIRQIQKTSSQVAASSEELTASADQSSEVTQTIAVSVTTVAEMSGNQVQIVNKASSIVEQMSAGIEETAATIGVAAEQSAKALDTAKEGNQAIDNAVRQMNNIESTVTHSADVVAKLGERSKEIGQIVDTISGIAGQTNLLALNAAIEAARAGEQGKGFAVVAEEVRKLAEQSQEAAKQIGNLISEIRGDTDQAVVAMQEGTKEVKVGAEVVTSAGGAFTRILEMVSEINNQSTDIAATMQELASGTQEIVNSVQEIDHSGKQVASEAESVSAATQQQSASMEEIAAASRNLSNLAEQMEQAVGKFKF